MGSGSRGRGTVRGWVLRGQQAASGRVDSAPQAGMGLAVQAGMGLAVQPEAPRQLLHASWGKVSGHQEALGASSRGSLWDLVAEGCGHVSRDWPEQEAPTAPGLGSPQEQKQGS